MMRAPARGRLRPSIGVATRAALLAGSLAWLSACAGGASSQVSFEQSAYNQPPHTGFHIGAGMADPPVPDIRIVRR
jgi:hypothetical protein